MGKIIESNEVQYREGIKEIFISSKKDRTPANIIFRLSSDFEEDKNKKLIDNFIETSPSEVLKQHFITKEIVDLYKEDKIDDFILKREDYLKLKESEFVNKIGIRYVN